MRKLIRSIIAATLIAGAFSLFASNPAQAQTPATDPAAATTAAPAAPTAPPPPERAPRPAPFKKRVAPAEPPPPTKTTATVITNEGWSERCILATVVTAVDGKEVTATDKTDVLELEPGEHSISGYSISGYGGTDPTKCATFTGDNPVAIAEGEHIGQSTLKYAFEAGKTYYTGVDARKADKSTWKVVVWQIKH
jgi:hypothetical protein